MKILQGKQISFKHSVCGTNPFDFALPSGKRTVLIGPNGSGKTTFCRAILGEKVLAGGRIYFNEEDRPIDVLHAREIAERLAFVPQDPLYRNGIMVEDFLRLAFIPKTPLFKPLPQTSPEMDRVADVFQLRPFLDKPLDRLSSGERQRIFLARAILQQPKLLILDEPTNHLDPGHTELFWNQLLKSAISLLIITHERDFIREHADWICALKKGGLFFNGPREHFFQEHDFNELYRIENET